MASSNGSSMEIIRLRLSLSYSEQKQKFVLEPIQTIKLGGSSILATPRLRQLPRSKGGTRHPKTKEQQKTVSSRKIKLVRITTCPKRPS